MAELQVEGDELVMHLSTAEKLGGVHGDLRVPVSAVRGVEVLPDAHGPADGGIKVGTRISGTIEYGTIWQAGRKGCTDPETVAQTITAMLTGGAPAA